MVAHSLPRGQRAQVSVCSLNYSGHSGNFVGNEVRISRSTHSREFSTTTQIACRTFNFASGKAPLDSDISRTQRLVSGCRLEEGIGHHIESATDGAGSGRLPTFLFPPTLQSWHLQPELDNVVRLATLSLFSTFFDSNQTHA